MNIIQAKKELYQTLHSSEDVVGAGIQEKDGNEFIVIYTAKPKKELKIKIPTNYKGYKVKTIKIGIVRAQ